MFNYTPPAEETQNTAPKPQQGAAKKYQTRPGIDMVNVVIERTPSLLEAFAANVVKLCGIKTIFGYKVSRTIGYGNDIGDPEGLITKGPIPLSGRKHFVKADKTQHRTKKNRSLHME